MIWYNKILELSGIPDNIEFRLQGIFDTSGGDIIKIIINNNANLKPVICYTHNPSMLTREDPQAEDILAKYQAKINKITNKFKSYQDIYPKSLGRAFPDLE